MKSRKMITAWLLKTTLLTLLILLNLQAQSQTATNKPIVKDTVGVVILKKEVAQKVLKELNDYDALKVDYSLLSKADSLLYAASLVKDSTIKVYKGQSKLYKQLVDTLGYQSNLKDKQIILLHKEIKNEKTAIFLLKGIAFLAVIANFFLHK